MTEAPMVSRKEERWDKSRARSFSRTVAQSEYGFVRDGGGVNGLGNALF